MQALESSKGVQEEFLRQSLEQAAYHELAASNNRKWEQEYRDRIKELEEAMKILKEHYERTNPESA